MTRNLVVLGDKSPVGAALEGKFGVASEFTPATSPRTTQVDPENVLFIDAGSFGESNIPANEYVVAALERGIPIVISEPSKDLLGNLTGLGTENVEAVIIVKGNGPFFYTQPLMGPDTSGWEYAVASIALPQDEQGEDDKGDSSISEIPPPTPVASPLVKADIPKVVIEAFEAIDEIESKLRGMAESNWQSNNVPDNRKWSHYWDPGIWFNFTRNDPSGETNKTQNLRFYLTLIFQLLAADEPVKVKVLDIVSGGAGFQPILMGEEMIRNDSKHRGWAQSLTYIEFDPEGKELGTIQDYAPANSANEVSVTTAYSWDVGYSVGIGPDGPEASVDFSFGLDHSKTKSSLDFRTLTDFFGHNGVRFYHNANIVGGNTEVDPRYFFGSEWTDEMNRMFSGSNVRSWPSLSRETVKPDCECIWYIDPEESSFKLMRLKINQGVNYCYNKSGRNYFGNHHNWTANSVYVRMNYVDYDDPPPPSLDS